MSMRHSVADENYPLGPLLPNVLEIKKLLNQVNHMLSIQQKQLHNTINETHQAVHVILGQVVQFEEIVKCIVPQFDHVHQSMEGLIHKNLSQDIALYAEERQRRAQWQHEKIESILQEAYQMISGMRLIESISKRTRFIALNAHIESAHAGQYGRCFAIIAEEIRDLSGQSETGAKQVLGSLQSLRTHFEDFSTDQEESYRKEKYQLKEITVEAHTFQSSFEKLGAPSDAVSQQILKAQHKLQEITSSIYLAMQFQDVTRQQIEHIVENLEICQTSISDVLSYLEDPNVILKEIDTEAVFKKYTMQSERDIFGSGEGEMPPPVELF